MKIDKEKIGRLMSRGVHKIIPGDKHLWERLHREKLRVKHGLDPTGEKIHLGRAVALRKLRDFQDLGHKIILIIGDFTARIGDPSDKLEKRPFLTGAQIKRNLKNYLPQIGKILNLKKCEVYYNSAWLQKLNFEEVSRLAEVFSVRQMLERRNFSERYSRHEEISLREFLYPLMQGYDSVAIKAEVEVGGGDQLFNLLAGRKIQEAYSQKPQDVLTVRMLLGTDGRKMSTSWGNVINISDRPRDMFGKTMSLKDELLSEYFQLATDLEGEEINEILNQPPLERKQRLAFEITKLYHGQKAADDAEEFFVKTFRKKELYNVEKTTRFSRGEGLAIILKRAGAISSFSEYRRLVQGGAIEIDGKVISNPNFKPDAEAVVRVGKHRFLKISP